MQRSLGGNGMKYSIGDSIECSTVGVEAYRRIRWNGASLVTKH